MKAIPEKRFKNLFLIKMEFPSINFLSFFFVLFKLRINVVLLGSILLVYKHHYVPPNVFFFHYLIKSNWTNIYWAPHVCLGFAAGTAS